MSFKELADHKIKVDEESTSYDEERVFVHAYSKPRIPMYHYEDRGDEFLPGRVYRNFNGSDYRMIERYQNDRYLFDRVDTGMFLIAGMPRHYIRYDVEMPRFRESGFEWNYATYLSRRQADVDFDFLREQYGAYTPPKTKARSFLKPKLGGHAR